MAREFDIETAPGVRCGRVLRGLGRVGLYVPAGSAPLPSTALMGWNRLRACGRSALMEGIDGEYAYFVHGYAASAAPAYSLADSTHGDTFAALVASGRLCGAQFHPERSARAGERLLKNFLEMTA